MATGIKIIAQHYDISTGEVLESQEILNDELHSPNHLKDLGYLHLEQIDLLSKCQDFKISRQIKLVNNSNACPICGSKTVKMGKYTSDFHAIFSDHTVEIQRIKCKGGCNLPYKLEGLFGSNTHPDLLKKQAELTAEKSYVKASKELNYDSLEGRAINNRTHLSRVSSKVSAALELIKTQDIPTPEKGVDELVAVIDGGHIKDRGEGRSFEAMTAAIYHPDNVEYIDKNHTKITKKQVVASAKDDNQQCMRLQFKNACISEGLGKNTNITCLADGAKNCWTVAHSISTECQQVLCILDWFHIGMKFKNNQSAISDDKKDEYEAVKWCLWHGNSEKAITKLQGLIDSTECSKSKNKLNKLQTYITNNKDKIVNYDQRDEKGLIYASSYAESTVNNLINVRQKNKQRMTWTREGAHQIIQIRAAKIGSNWEKDWLAVENKIYRKAA